MSKLVKLSDLVNNKKVIEISDEMSIEVRPLPVKTMVNLLVNQTDKFIELYSLGAEGKLTAKDLGPFLVAAPRLVADIIALASGEPEKAEEVENYMPASVQLIALGEIWKLSVPDPKKAKELLSGVTSLLQKLFKGQEIKENPETKQLNDSQKEF